MLVVLLKWEVRCMDEELACGKFIKRISEELRKNANNTMRSQNMTMAQLEALMELNRAPEKQLSLKELEQNLHVAQSTAAGIVVRLEQKGFARSFGDASDRRVKLVGITSAGAECAAAAQKDMLAVEDRLFSGLTRTERNIFRALLEKICGGLS